MPTAAKHEDPDDVQPDGVNAQDELTPEGQAVQDAEDVVTSLGYRGTKVDPTENHAYTVAGVTSGVPTPETHPEQADLAGSRKFEGA